MARKKHVNIAVANEPAKDKFPIVREYYGDPSYMIRPTHSEPSVFNGIVSVERYQIRVDKIDEPEDVIVARLKRMWRTSQHNHHHWHPVRAYLMKTFGWDHARTIREFPSDEQGIEYVEPTR